MKTKSITIWRKMTVISTDGIKKVMDVPAFESNYIADVEHYKAACKANKFRFIRLTKTTYNQFGEKI